MFFGNNQVDFCTKTSYFSGAIKLFLALGPFVRGEGTTGDWRVPLLGPLSGAIPGGTISGGTLPPNKRRCFDNAVAKLRNSKTKLTGNGGFATWYLWYINMINSCLLRLLFNLYDLELSTGVLISPMIMLRKLWENRPFKTPFYINVMNEGITL